MVNHAITHREMVRLAKAFAPNRKEFVECHAYLKDLCVGPGAKLIGLDLLPHPDWITTSSGRHFEKPGTLQDLELVLNHVWRNKEVRGMVRNIVKYCKSEGLK